MILGLGGVSFNAQPALGYVESITNSNAPTGSLWVEDSSLHWTDGSREYFTTEGGIIMSAWDFSSNSGTAYDKYRTLNGNLEEGASMTSGAGYYGDGVSLGGGYGDGVDYGHLWDDHTRSRTFAFWFKENGASSGDRIISQDCSEWFCVTDDGSGQIHVQADGSTYGNYVSVSETGWNHLALSFNEETSTLTVFKDGNQIDSYSYSSSWNHLDRPVVLGANTEGYGDLSGGEWEGAIDEFKMYEAPLNEKQVEQIYSKGRDRFRTIKGNYHFDSGSGGTAVDSSGWNNDGDIVGATWVSGKRDGALSFDGSDDYVGLPDGIYEFMTSESFTVNFWMKTSSTSEGYVFYPNGDADSRFVFNPTGSNRIGYQIYDGSGSVWLYSSSINDGNWHQVSATYDEIDDQMKLYVDGTQVDSASQDSPRSVSRGNSIGVQANQNANYFSGDIDELSVYSKALPENRIKELYQGTGSRPSGPTGSTWIEDSSLRYIDQSGYERIADYPDTGYNPSGANKGNAWMEDGHLHYIDLNGNERSISPVWQEGFEGHSDGHPLWVANGWETGSDCGTCEVSNNRAESGTKSAYQNVASSDDWQNVMTRDYSSQPLTGNVKVSFEYWESSSNHDGNLWVRACDGTNIAGIGTENPQFEGVTGTNGEVVNVNPGAEYQRWTHAEMDIDLASSTVDFYWSQDGSGASANYDSYSIPSGKKICTVGVGPDDVWYVDDITVKNY